MKRFVVASLGYSLTVVGSNWQHRGRCNYVPAASEGPVVD